MDQLLRWGLAALVLLSTGLAHADTMTLGSSQDNTLFAEDGALSNGGGAFLFVGTTDGGDARRALLAFDMTDIPAGSTITAVTLSLFMSRAKSNTGFEVSLHNVTADWGEGTSDASGEEGAGASAATNDATWTHRFFATDLWSTPGGDFAAAASATTVVDRDGSRFAWTSAAMIADVQGWLDAPATAFGWMLVGAESATRTAKRFDSRDNADLARRPVLTVTFTPPSADGACCTSGVCSEGSAAACAGIYRGDGTTCAGVTCPLPTGACCAGDGTCAVTTGASCAGTYQGDMSACTPNPCPIPDGACCAGGGCTLVSDPGTSCLGTYLGALTTCAPDPCTVTTGACCTADGSCSIVAHPGGTCVGGYQGRDSLCAPNPCPQPTGACCATDGSCATETSAACIGTWRGAGFMCGPGVCPQPTSACCASDGGCTVTTSATCSGTFMSGDLACAPNPCPQPSGPCCSSDGACASELARDCVGTWLGAAAMCAPNPCPQPTGACCADDGTCTVETVGSCTGSFLAGTSTCAAETCPVVLERFVDPLPLPAVATPTIGMTGGAAEYRMRIVQLEQQLHRDLPLTTVWGYDDGTTGGTYPGPTIEARSGEPVRVTWENDLRDAAGALRTEHFLAVDSCAHGAETSAARTVVHLHGGHVAAAFDGYPESTALPGESAVYDYPNGQEAAGLWYHDHALGITRLNVYMGLAGLYTIRDDVEEALGLPSGEFEVPLVIQDRSFDRDGALVYPAAWQEHFFGDTIVVNGRVWPFLEVAQGKYRFRVLNGSNSRTYELYLSDGSRFTVIGGDGGLLEAPVVVDQLTMGPGERMDVIVDFAGMAVGTEVIVGNRAPAPYPGRAGEGVIPEILKLVVVDRPGPTDPLPGALRPIPRLVEADAVTTRDFELRRGDDDCSGRAWLINDLRWDDITERPNLGTSEVWRFINRSGIAHPMHMHLVFFQVLDRQSFDLVDDIVTPVGAPRAANPTETGPKDTVMVGPNEIVRVIARFEDFVGRYAYHCHILEHEDHEMMRQFETVTTCGDGARGVPGEECDDGNLEAGDGCSPTCILERGSDAGPDSGPDAGRDSGPLDASDGDAEADAAADGGAPPPPSGGCGCHVAAPSLPSTGLLVLLLLGFQRSRRARRGPRRRG